MYGESVLQPLGIFSICAGLLFILAMLFLILGQAKRYITVRLVDHMLKKPVSGDGAFLCSVIRAALGKGKEIVVPPYEGDIRVYYDKRAHMVMVSSDVVLVFEPDEYERAAGMKDKGFLASFEEMSFGNTVRYFVGCDQEAGTEAEG